MSLVNLITVIIPTYNRANILSRAIDSVLNQSHENLELLVVDDYSTDNTKEVIHRYDDPRVKYLVNQRKKGAQGARNTGLYEAIGSFVTGLDDDDKWLPKRLELMLKAYEDNYAYVTSDVYIEGVHRRTRVNRERIITLKKMLFYNAAGNQILVPINRVINIDGYDENLSAAQDYDLFLRLNDKFGDAINVCKPLQVINERPEIGGRISDNSFMGYYQFYCKHKNKFSTEQRRYQLLNIRKSQSKPISLKMLFKLCPYNYLYYEIKQLIKQKIRLK